MKFRKLWNSEKCGIGKIVQFQKLKKFKLGKLKNLENCQIWKIYCRKNYKIKKTVQFINFSKLQDCQI